VSVSYNAVQVPTWRSVASRSCAALTWHDNAKTIAALKCGYLPAASARRALGIAVDGIHYSASSLSTQVPRKVLTSAPNSAGYWNKLAIPSRHASLPRCQPRDVLSRKVLLVRHAGRVIHATKHIVIMGHASARRHKREPLIYWHGLYYLAW
jgi:hypothetical protein